METTDRTLEQFVGLLDDDEAWDTLGRLGWRLVDFDGEWETWAKVA